MSVCVTWFLVELIKRMYGELRPDYLSRCFNSSDPSVWMAGHGWQSWDDMPEIVDCSASLLSTQAIEDGRMSFPSGHTAFSWSISFFVAVWLFAKLTLYRNWGAWRVALPLCPISLAIIISVSRTSDYRHHSHDVLTAMSEG